MIAEGGDAARSFATCAHDINSAAVPGRSKSNGLPVRRECGLSVVFWKIGCKVERCAAGHSAGINIPISGGAAGIEECLAIGPRLA
jgi:hypothetical protein